MNPSTDPVSSLLDLAQHSPLALVALVAWVEVRVLPSVRAIRFDLTAIKAKLGITASAPEPAPLGQIGGGA